MRRGEELSRMRHVQGGDNHTYIILLSHDASVGVTGSLTGIAVAGMRNDQANHPAFQRGWIGLREEMLNFPEQHFRRA